MDSAVSKAAPPRHGPRPSLRPGPCDHLPAARGGMARGGPRPSSSSSSSSPWARPRQASPALGSPLRRSFWTLGPAWGPGVPWPHQEALRGSRPRPVSRETEGAPGREGESQSRVGDPGGLLAAGPSGSFCPEQAHLPPSQAEKPQPGRRLERGDPCGQGPRTPGWAVSGSPPGWGEEFQQDQQPVPGPGAPKPRLGAVRPLTRGPVSHVLARTDERLLEYISVRPSEERAGSSHVPGPLSIPPTLCPSFPPAEPPAPPSLHHAEGQRSGQRGRVEGLPPPGGAGGSQRASRAESRLQIGAGRLQRQEKLNNPVTSMKVKSRSAAHGKYEGCVRRECGRRCPLRRAVPLQGPGQRRGGAHAQPAGRPEREAWREAPTGETGRPRPAALPRPPPVSGADAH